MFLAGSSYGVHLFSPTSGMYYNGANAIAVDSAGSVYVGGSTLQRWAPGSTYMTTLLNGSSWGYYYYYYSSQRIAFDNFGNMILKLPSTQNLGLYSLLTNTC